MKYAVIYYSKSGVTKKIAEIIRDKFGADLYFVEPENAYGNYLSAVVRVGKEKLIKKNPGVKTKPVDFSEYDAVFIGFPVWYGTMPPFEQEYVSRCDLAGKIVIPFATAGSTGKDVSLNTMKKLCPNSKLEHYFFTSMREKADVNAWLDEIAADYR